MIPAVGVGISQMRADPPRLLQMVPGRGAVTSAGGQHRGTQVQGPGHVQAVCFLPPSRQPVLDPDQQSLSDVVGTDTKLPRC